MSSEQINTALVKAARNLNGRTLHEAAAAFVASHERDPAWADWLHSIVVEVIHDRMRLVVRSDRATTTSVGRTTGKFSADVEAGVGVYDMQYCVSAANDWKFFGDMRRPEVLFVASSYDDRARSNAFEASFLRAVAKRCTGTRRVRDVLSEDQLLALRAQLGGENAA